MRGCGDSRSACGTSSLDSVPICFVLPTSYFVLPTFVLLLRTDFSVAFFERRFSLARQRSDQRVAPVHELLAHAATVRRSDRVLAEQRKRYRRIAVGDDRVRQYARIHLAPAHRFGRRRAGEPAPHHLVRR